VGQQKGPASTSGEPRPEVSTREKFAAMAKARPPAPRVRNIVWIAVGVLALGIAAAQFLGLAKNPVETRIRGEVAEREAEKAARESKPLPPPAHAGFDETVPFPTGLSSEVSAPLEDAFAVASKSALGTAQRAVERLPALAAAAPEDRRREVRAFVLRRLEPLLRAGIDAPLAAEARAAAAEILKADPGADPGADPAAPR
jgi:hypothetical protein